MGQRVSPNSTRTDAQRARAVRYLENHPEVREKQRLYSLERMRRLRSLDPQTRNLNAFYAQMVDRYGELCAICGKERSQTRRLCIDHDHATDEVRGLLCFRCNNVLGFVADSADLLHKMVAYLTRSEFTNVKFEEAKERGAILGGEDAA